jgi:hypothetical protein
LIHETRNGEKKLNAGFRQQIERERKRKRKSCAAHLQHSKHHVFEALHDVDQILLHERELSIRRVSKTRSRGCLIHVFHVSKTHIVVNAFIRGIRQVLECERIHVRIHFEQEDDDVSLELESLTFFEGKKK